MSRRRVRPTDLASARPSARIEAVCFCHAGFSIMLLQSMELSRLGVAASSQHKSFRKRVRASSGGIADDEHEFASATRWSFRRQPTNDHGFRENGRDPRRNPPHSA